MFFWPGKKVIVSLADGTALTAVTRLSVNTLRLKSVEYPTPNGETMSAKGRVVVPITAILTVQVIS